MPIKGGTTVRTPQILTKANTIYMIKRLIKHTLLSAFTLAAINCTHAQVTTTTAGNTERIVSLNGSNTEILFALGVGDQIVGRDDSAMYPPEAQNIPSIGYQYQLNSEGIVSLKPTLVIGRSDAKPAQAIEQIKATGIKVELIDEPDSLAEAGQRITKVGAIVNREAKAAELVSGLAADIKAFEARKAELGDAVKKKAIFLYLRGPKVTFVLGNETSPGRIIELAGAQNAMPEVTNTAPITAEALVAAQPEVIVTFTHGIESIGGIDGLLKLPGVALTPAGKNKRIIIMDDLYLGGFTHRAGKAALDLLNAFQAEGISTVKGK